MDSKQFKLAVFVAVCVVTVVITVGVFMNRQAEINRSAEIRQEEIRQEEKTVRTKERWGVLPWNRDSEPSTK